MKKFLLSFSCIVMILIVAVGCVFGGGAEVFHISLGNIEIITGGNDAVGGVRNANMMKIFEDKEYKLNRSYQYSSLGVSLEEAWAHHKFTSKFELDDYSNTFRGSITLRPKEKLVAQIPANTIPKKNVLLNADTPISITSCSDEISLFYSRNLDSDTEAVRVLDEKGKVIATLGDPYSESYKPTEVKLSHEFKNYYLELKKYAGKYCYIFLRMKTTDIPVKQSKILAEEENRRKGLANLEEEVTNEYMKQHNISDVHDLTQADREAIVEILKDRTTLTDLRDFRKTVDQIYKDYMKKHSISDYNQLTPKDHQAIQNEIQKAHTASLTPEQKKKFEKDIAKGEQVRKQVIQAYMKKHSISDESKLTQKDWKVLGKEIQQALKQAYSKGENQNSEAPKKSSSKKKRK